MLLYDFAAAHARPWLLDARRRCVTLLLGSRRLIWCGAPHSSRQRHDITNLITFKQAASTDNLTGAFCLRARLHYDLGLPQSVAP